MKIAVLTTQTPHHAYFVRALAGTCGDVVAFNQTTMGPKAPFDVHHAFEDERDQHEWRIWFGGKVTAIAELVPTHDVPTMNAPASIDALRHAAADVVIVFGTSVLKQPVIDICPGRVFNLHGGDPEEYRGRDTHLWAILHRDFAALITTLHRVDAGIDTGDIVVQGKIPLAPDMPLYALRAANTEVCVKLATTAVDMIARHGDVVGRPQRRKGRYYSAMPSDLKAECNVLFASYVKKLGYGSR